MKMAGKVSKDRLSIAARQHSREKKYWLDYLAGNLVKSGFPIDHPGERQKPGNRFEEFISRCSGETGQRLWKLSNRSLYTLNALLAAGLTWLLHRYTGNTDLIVGTSIYRQEHDGPFINTLLILRNRLDPRQTVKELLQQVSRGIYQGTANQDYPLEILPGQLNPKGGDDPASLFDVVFFLENIHPQEYLRQIRVNMRFGFLQEADRLRLRLEYNPSLYRRETAERISAALWHLLEQAVDNLDLPLAAIDTLPEPERHRLLHEFNRNRSPFSRDKSLSWWIEQRAGVWADRMAVVCHPAGLTYGPLNALANRWANCLQAKGIGPDSLVAICCPRSLEMAVAILATWKAGGAYIPLDPNYPLVRLVAILADSHPEVFLTTSGAIASFPQFLAEVGTHTHLRQIVFMDEETGANRYDQLFKTSRYAADLSRGIDISPGTSLVLRDQRQALTYPHYMARLSQWEEFFSHRGIELQTPVGIVLENPIYRVMALLYLKNRHIPFLAIEPGLSTAHKKKIIESSSLRTLFTESRFLDETDRLTWESPTLTDYFILDSDGRHSSEKEHQFKDIWDYIAQESSEAANDYGWTSSYTNEPFSLEEMAEYTLNFEAKLAPYLTPRTRVLDIGCGHGLVLFAIAPRVGYYLATDLSPVIIRKNKQRIQREKLSHVTLKQAAASQLDQLEEKDFDIVLCSSVIHYFPNTLYLEQVIKDAIHLLKDRGLIYLDDLLALGKKEELIRSTREYKRRNPQAQVKTDWEGDLFVGLDFFHDLSLSCPEIVEWQYSRKIGRIKNELTRFRCDILLKVDKTLRTAASSPRKKNRYFLPGAAPGGATDIGGGSDVSPQPQAAPGNSPPGKPLLAAVNDSSVLAAYPPGNPRQTRDLSHLAYVIYTSGSTGKPKGVMVEHLGMMNHLQAKINELQLNETSIIAQNASHTFDISVWQFFTALKLGGKTVIYPEATVMNPGEFTWRTAADGVTILEVVPSYLAVMLEGIEAVSPPPALPFHYLLVTGEELKPHLVKRWFHCYPRIKMVNAYGPTEASDDITHHLMDRAPAGDTIPIGKPLQNLSIYIVDDHMRPSPLGVKGEIQVSGVGTGRGYLNNPEVTAKNFNLTSPDQKSLTPNKKFLPGQTTYKTGDLGRWLPDGTIEFFGRKDHQVKIRGFRIELGEIETRLQQYPAIKEAVVLDREDTAHNKYLCAYFTTGRAVGDVPPAAPLLKDHLAQKLPYYMIPAYFVAMERFPLTPNGKIDRGALPAPESVLAPVLPYITAEMLERVKVNSLRGTGESEEPGPLEPGTPELSTEEKTQILVDFNNTSRSYSSPAGLHCWAEAQAVKTPDAIAAVNNNQRLSYRRLDSAARLLARHLRGKGVKPGILVGLMGERSIHILTGILAILQAGGAYLPMGPEDPRERARYMLKDCQVEILLLNRTPPPAGYAGLVVDLAESAGEHGDEAILPLPAPPGGKATDPVYINYTSGTTGNPKGVIIEMRAVLNLFHAMGEIIDYRAGESILSLITISFDVFVTETLLPLTRGLNVVLGSAAQQLNPFKTSELVVKERVALLQATPAMVQAYVSDRGMSEALKGLRYLLVTGEAFPAPLLEKIQALSAARIYNLYGPTEATVWATVKEVTAEKTVNIGKPIANVRIYLRDARGGLTPLGAAGELYIGGYGIARGYLNNPELTVDKFKIINDKLIIKNGSGTLRANLNAFGTATTHHSPLTQIPARRATSLTLTTNTNTLYKTGDLARWLPGGDIEFLGRIDHQVKIRGLRIEPGEIEYFLATHPDLQNAVVIPRIDKNGDTYLCAFVVSANPLPETALRDYLSTRLPQYMIPALFIQLATIPRTPSGKVNRRLLAALTVESSRGKEIKTPVNATETQLREIWAEVLGIDQTQIGTDDNFFDLGGHSLRATVLLSRIHKKLEVKIPLGEFFDTPTIAGLARFMARTAAEKYTPIATAIKKDYYALSSAQERLFILQQMDKESTAYNIPLILVVDEEPWLKRFNEAFTRLIQRHESLRTSFPVINGQPVQRVHDRVDFAIQRLSLPAGNPPPVEKAITHFLRPFDLSRAPLLRAALLKIHDREHLLMIDMHHIISDGISQVILMEDFSTFYAGEDLPPLKLQYKDYSEWQHQQREKEPDTLLKKQDFWLRQFQGELPVLHLPTDFSRPALQRFEGDALDFALEPQETRKLKALALRQEATLFMVTLALYNVLLTKLSGQEDIVVGAPIAGREHADLEKIIGMFVNALALKNSPQGEKSFIDFLKEVKQTAVQAFENQAYPFEDLVDKVAGNRDLSRHPLYTAGFTLNNLVTPSPSLSPSPPAPQGNLAPRIKSYAHKTGVAKIDLNLLGVEAGEQLLFSMEYCTKLFTQASIQRFIGYFKKIVTGVTSEPGLKIKELEILSHPEKQQLLAEFNQTAGWADIPTHKRISHLVAEQVARTPHRAAALGRGYRRGTITENLTLTFRELDKTSAHLAGRLQARGVQADTLVALMLESSLETVLGILAILKAGGAYLPLDPTYPRNRLHYMLGDSKTRILVTTRPLLEQEKNENFGHWQGETILMEEETAGKPPPPLPPCRIHQPLAYVIYTSGTTGTPKGVLINHKGLINYTLWRIKTYAGNENDITLQPLSHCFDGFAANFYSSLASGGKLVMLPDNRKLDIDYINREIQRQQVTNVSLVPGFFAMLLERAVPADLSSLRFVVLAGERSTPSLVRQSRQKLPHLCLFNEYGPTETTVTAAGNRDMHEGNTSVIGKPVPHTGIYVLDAYLEPVPVKVAGELYISGPGTARGYLNNPESTAEKFRLRRPGGFFSRKPPPWTPGISVLLESFYRTGDLARWLPEGNLEFLGRLDLQVKIRGQRIELGEIVNRLLRHPAIKDAVATAAGEENQQVLSAFIVATSPLDAPGLRQFLAGDLPDYMIPSSFIQVEQIPLTPNGKIDKKALASTGTSLGSTNQYIAPQKEMEKSLARIWQEVLKQEKIGVDDNFFDLGGNSARLIQVHSRLKEMTAENLPLIILFEHPTLRSLSRYLDEKTQRAALAEEESQQFTALQENNIDMFKQTLRILDGESND